MQHIQGISRNQLQVSSLEDTISADNLPLCHADTGGIPLTYSRKSKNQKSQTKSVTRPELLRTGEAKTTPAKLEERITKIKEIQRGWLNYTLF